METEIWMIIATLLSGAIGTITSVLLGRKKVQEKEEQIQDLIHENNSIEIELEETKKSFPKDLKIIDDVSDVLKDHLLPIIIEQAIKKKYIKIDNFGLDLETVMPWINTKIINSPKLENVTFEMRALILNPKSEYMKAYIDGHSSISTSTITASIQSAKRLSQLDLYKFKFSLRQYNLPPIFHGFVLNDEHLFISFSEIFDNKIIGGTKPYLHLCKQDDNISEISMHYFNFFKNWFDYYWKTSIEITNTEGHKNENNRT